MSTSSTAARSYHHGDLRAALVEAGLKSLETTDMAEISLRQLARSVGVSATAVYRHFPDKRALLAALADDGFVRLGKAKLAASESISDRRQAFAATGRAYVRFALAYPQLFRLMFACTATDTGMGSASAGIAAQMLESNAMALSGGNAEDSQRLAIQAWAIVHGLAMLMLDGLVPADEALIDRVIDSETLFRT